MITTKDIKTKETKSEKLKIITTDKVHPKEFEIKGKSTLRDKTLITTSNIEKFQKRGKKK